MEDGRLAFNRGTSEYILKTLRQVVSTGKMAEAERIPQ